MRTIASVLLGYVAMAAVVFGGLTLAYLALGPGRAFRPGSYDVSALWIVLSIAIGFGAAVLGGWIARRVGRNDTAPRALAGVVLVLGLLLALPALLGTAEPQGVRPDDLASMDAMRQARTPLWIMLLNPVIGAVGVLLGGSGRSGTTPDGA